MKSVLGFLVFVGAWLIGCSIFDGWLGLTGAWLMLGGAVTFAVCNFLQRMVNQ